MGRRSVMCARDVACDACGASIGRVCRRAGRAMSGYHLVRHAALLSRQRELARKEFSDG